MEETVLWAKVKEEASERAGGEGEDPIDSRDNVVGDGGVDGVFWYTKHVHYTLVWI
jgi:hypothetical protein